MQQYQKILNLCIIMVVYEIIFFSFFQANFRNFIFQANLRNFIFEANLRNQEIVNQNNIAEKYYKIGRSELR